MARDYLASLKKAAEDLEHYGVKGMKWGVHRTPVTKLQTKAHEKAVGDMEKSGISALNQSSKYAGKDLNKDPKLRKEYEKDAADLFDHYYADRIRRAQMVKTYKKAAVISLAGSAARFGAIALAVHADEKPDIINLKLELNDLGHIVGFREVDEDLLANYDGELEHFGIKGMRWGVRRSDDQIKADVAKKAAKGEPVTPTKSAASTTKTDSTSGPETSAQRYSRLTQKAKESGASSLSDDDLKFINNRTEAVAKVNKMFAKKESWLAETSKKVLQKTAQAQMQSISNGIADKYISGPVLAGLKNNSAAIKAESKTPVDYVGRRRADTKKKS